MKTRQFLIWSLLLVSGIFIMTSCEKYIPGTGGKQDKFDVSVSENTTVPGAKITYETNDNQSALKYTPSSAGMKSGGSGIWIGETEVTYSLWKEVYEWSLDNGYEMTKKGMAGNATNLPDDHPVTTVAWRDAVVWCNAFTEYYNTFNGDKPDYSFAYTSGGDPVKNADRDNSALNNVNYNSNATGFRLPTNDEWYAAAKYNGTPDDYASGANANFENDGANSAVAWYRDNANSSTHPVAQKLSNDLGLYDMSGNVRELVYDKLSKHQGKFNDRGGAWNSNANKIIISESAPIEDHSNSYALGFRLARTMGDDTHEDIVIEENEGGSGAGDLTLGQGEGFFTFGGIEYPISQAVMLNYNIIGAELITVELVSEDIDIERENPGGFTGYGNHIFISVSTTDEDLIGGKTYRSNEFLMWGTAYTNANMDVYPWESDRSYVFAGNQILEVSKTGDTYTLDFTTDGTVLPTGEEIDLDLEYTGTITLWNAGEDFK